MSDLFRGRFRKDFCWERKSRKHKHITRLLQLLPANEGLAWLSLWCCWGFAPSPGKWLPRTPRRGRAAAPQPGAKASPRSHRFFPVFFSKVYNFWFYVYVYDLLWIKFCIRCDKVRLIDNQLSQHPLLRNTFFFSCWNAFVLLWKINCLYIHGSISGPPSFFPWICLSAFKTISHWFECYSLIVHFESDVRPLILSVVLSDKF